MLLTIIFCYYSDDLNDLMIHYPDVDNAIHSHLGVGDDRATRNAIHLPLWSEVGGSGAGAGLTAAVTGRWHKSIGPNIDIQRDNFTQHVTFILPILFFDICR